ncbi:hypothetical protein ZIOFF_045274 [Zingiber officinale]|uniref:Acetyl-coenzyme A synthetase N-terminal domain-containing protein n=1 Tax=Zingiber officinale TaxID=94328 RepID=A0A8J5FWX4_ZINOF|nr:hypothetical protein ZIOFF_045274 [Zingiber officinale]
MTAGEVAVSPKVGVAFSNHLRHVESMSLHPSGASWISHLNVVILGEPLESEENDLVFPSQEFSSQALVSSPEQYRNMYKKSIEDPAGFWSEISSQFYWKEKWNPEVYTENINVRKGTVKFKKMANGGRVNSWTCINFAKNVQDNLTRGFCHELAQMCQISGMEFSLDPVLHPLTARPDHVERALSACYHDAMTILQP